MSNTQPRSYRLPSNRDFGNLYNHSHALLKPSYASYCSNPPDPVDPVGLPFLQLVPSTDIYVKILRDDINDKITSFTVSRVSDPSAINIMGYFLDEHCLAFRGEVRLLKEFLLFASDTVGFRTFEGCIMTGKEIRYPCPGLEKGLSFEDFAACVEIVEYVVILDSSMRDREVPNAYVATHHSSPPRISSPHRISSSPREFNFPPTPDVKYFMSKVWGPEPKESVPELDLSHSLLRCKTPMQDSDSSLSDPPEKVVTPPMMKRYSLRQQPPSAKYTEGSSSEDEPGRKKGKRASTKRRKGAR